MNGTGATDDRSMAIIGLSCRFPGDAKSPSAFWELLCKGQSAYSTVPKDRFNISAFHSGSRGGLNKSRTEGGHFLSGDIRRWDANFFGVTADEASAMDPQQRLMLEVAYEAFENAGVTPEQLNGSNTGVWMGVNSNDWRETLFRDPEAAPLHTWTGTGPEYISGRVSWFFNLRGPCMTVNTACSSSLVALHEARNAILAGDCKMAIVGGANLIFNPEYFLYYSNQMFLSPDGKCKSFDAAGDGFGRGEGLGAVVLKPLPDAVRDGDAIRAVLRGSGVGQDGWTSGITLPNAEAQADLIRTVYAEAGLSTSETGFVEAHGTGTKVGDPAELEAIANALGTMKGEKELLVGSVKTNIGHLEAAAGIAGLIKAVLILEKAQIPPTIGIEQLNPKIKWGQWKMSVSEELVPWPSRPGPRRISLSSFGASGTIAHAILDDGDRYSKLQNGTCGRQLRGNYTVADMQLIVLSAGDKEGVERQAASVTKHLRESRAATQSSPQDGTAYLRRLAFTLGAKRAHLAYRSFFVVSTIKELCNQLAPRQKGEDAGVTSPELVVRRAAAATTADDKLRIGMIFTGQGAQWARMGIELLKYEVFRQSIDRADDFLRQSLGCKWSVRDELGASAEKSNINKAEYSQPLCTVLQVALVDLLASWHITPVAVTGHSSGEISAAYALGVLSAEDAWTAAYWRGNLHTRVKQPRGAMMAAGMSQEEAQALVDRVPRSKGVVVVGCVNSPFSVTLSGDEDAVEAAGALLTEDGVFNRRLKVDAAYHSPHQARVSDEYFMRIRHIKPRPAQPGRVMFSSVTGKAVPSHRELGPANWVRNLVSPVLFAQSVEAMLRSEEAGVNVLLEVGPHAALAAPCQGTMSSCGITLDYLAVLSRGENAISTSMAAAGGLWAHGASVDIAAANEPEHGAQPGPSLLTDLPPYQWNHKRPYWTESRLAVEYRNRQHPHHRFLGAPLPTIVAGEHMWRALIRPSEEHWLRDHKIQGTVVYPAVGYIAMAVEAARQLATKDGQDGGRKVRAFRLRDVEFLAATQPGEHEPIEMTICARQAAQDQPGMSANATPGWYHFTISTCTDGQTVRKNSTGFVKVEYEPAPGSPEAYELAETDRDIQNRFFQAQDACRQSEDPESFYVELARIGLGFGPAFRNMSAIWMGESQSYCTVDVVNPSSERDWPLSGEGDEAERPFIIHPATFDPITQTIAPAMGLLSRTPVPTAIGELLISADIPYKVGERLHVFSSVVPRANHDLLSDIYALEESSHRPVLSLHGFKAAQLAPRDATGSVENAHNVCGRIVWKPALDLLLLSPEQLGRLLLDAAAGSVNVPEGMLREFMHLVFHNFPESSILEVRSQSLELADIERTPTIVEQLCEDIPAPWHHILDHTSAFWTGTATQKTSQSSGEEQLPISENAEFDIVVVRGRVPTEQLDALAQDIMKKKRKPFPLGLSCFTGHVDELETALCKAGAKPFVSIKAPGSDEGLLIIRTYDGTGLESGKTAETSLKESPEQDKGITVVLQAADPSELEVAVAEDLVKELQRQNADFTLINWDELDPGSSVLQKARVVCLVEVSTTLVGNLDETAFLKLKRLISNASDILWVTCQPHNKTNSDMPIKAAVDGLARSLKSEDARVKFRIAHFCPQTSPKPGGIAGLIKRLAFNKTRDEEFRVESLSDGDDLFVPYCSRVVPDVELSNHVEEKQNRSIEMVRRGGVGMPHNPGKSVNESTKESEAATLPSSSIIKLDIAERGQLDTLHFVQHEDEVADDLADDEVEVKVHASGLNFKDIMIALGRVVGTMEGAEGSGVVERIGKGVTTLNIQDRVLCLAIGMHASVVRIKASACRRIPDSMSFIDAASLPVVHCTAYNAFVRIARLETDETPGIRKTVLIHAAAGGLGQVAIQYAQHFGMEIFATVGSAAKRELVKELYGIPDDHVLCSRDASFAMAVKRMTCQRGVDLVLNSLSGEMLRQSWQCLAPGGTFIEVGKAVLDSVRPPGNEVGATYTVFDIEHIIRGDDRLTGRLLDGALEYVRRGITKPVSPCRKVPISDVHDAFRLMQTGRHIGKLLFSWADEVTVPVLKPNTLGVIASSPSARLRHDATYLLVGGLGGIGRSVARMLVDMGAQNLCFISRSGLRPEPARALAAELEARNVKIKVYECDAADAVRLQEVLSRCSAELPPIRGVLQCAMVLRDCTFANMDFAQWSEAVRPKIQASWNIHSQLLDHDIDFYVMLASFAGYFGNAGQSNYGAGCTFQDALAHYRRSKGLRAVSLDLGIISDVGVLAETGMTDNLRDWAPKFGIRERQLQNLIRITIQGQLAGGGVAPQVPTGFASLRAANAAGIPRPSYLDDPRFAILASDGRLAAQMSTDGKHQQEAAPSFQRRLDAAKAANSVTEARAVVSQMLTQKVAQCLKVAEEEVDPGKSLPSYGINSLVAIEIRNWIFKEINADVTIFNLISPVPLSKLVDKIVAGLLPEN